MAKYRIRVDVVNEADGTVQPFLNNGEPFVSEGAGFAIFAITDHEKSVEVHAALHDVSLYMLANVIAGNEYMRKAAKVALGAEVMEKFLKTAEGGRR